MKTRKIKGKPREYYIPEWLAWTPDDKKWTGTWGYFTINQLVTHPDCVVNTIDKLRMRMTLNKFAGCSLFTVMTTPITSKNRYDTTEFDNFLKIMWLFKPLRHN